jgi:hypothetical protein
MKNFDLKKCSGKGLKGIIIYGITFVIISFIMQCGELSQMTVNDMVTMLLNVEGIGTITIGSLLMMLLNWFKNRK